MELGRPMPAHTRGWMCVALLAVAVGCDGASPDVPPEGQGLPLGFVPITLEGSPPLAITEIAFIPGTSELLALHKSRFVTHYRLDAAHDRAVRLGELEVPGVDETADCGLLSVAFDPDFATNRLVYFAACESVQYSRISRHVFDPSDAGSIAATATTVIRVGTDDATRAWHNIGSIGFDRDGYLWALFGDKNEPLTAQDVSTNLGAVIRIMPDRAGAGYTPASTNPFVGLAGRSPDLAALGLRSPWRGALDAAGRLWIGDVGDNAFEEVNVTRFAGENFGSSLAEGPCASACDGLTDPIASWDRSNDHRYATEDPDAVPTPRRIVWVGIEYPRTVEADRYRGLLFDRMLVGDFAGGWIRAIGLDEQDRVIADVPAGHLENVTSWALGPDGYLYASTYGSALAWPYQEGGVYRAILAGAQEP